MAADGATTGPRTARRAALPAIAVMLGFLAAGLALGGGAGRGTALGAGLVALGVTLWIGALAASETRPAVDERTRRQRQRSIAIALGLAALVVMFYVATLVRLGPNALRKEGPGQPAAGNKIPATDPVVCKRTGAC